jgi:hypothetical protein
MGVMVMPVVMVMVMVILIVMAILIVIVVCRCSACDNQEQRSNGRSPKFLFFHLIHLFLIGARLRAINVPS